MNNKFPSIEQYRHAIRAVKDHCAFHQLALPTLQYVGLPKIHGTNAGIHQDMNNGDFVYLSRNRTLQIGNDNANFAGSMNVINHELRDLFFHMRADYHLTIDSPLTIYGEWCGPGIQSGVAVNQFAEKAFIIFAARSGDKWLDLQGKTYQFMQKCNVFFIYCFPHWYLNIDFNAPELYQNTMVEITEKVEALCPVGYQFGIHGVGEGVVWKPVSPEWSDARYWFKVKGEKHSSSKVATLAEVDVEAIARKNDLIEAVCTGNRMEQMWTEFLLAKNMNPFDVELKHIGDYLRMVFNDIIKEEADRIEKSGFKQKELGKGISDRAKRFYMVKINGQA